MCSSELSIFVREFKSIDSNRQIQHDNMLLVNLFTLNYKYCISLKMEFLFTWTSALYIGDLASELFHMVHTLMQLYAPVIHWRS